MTVRITCRCGHEMLMKSRPTGSIECTSCGRRIRAVKKRPKQVATLGGSDRHDSDVYVPGDDSSGGWHDEASWGDYSENAEPFGFGSSEFDSLLSDEYSGAVESPDVADEQFSLSGSAARQPFDCPKCGASQRNRSAAKCSDCHHSFRKGPCAGCGQEIGRKNKKTKKCRCSMRPVISGDRADSLCTQCGKTLPRAGWLSRTLFNNKKEPLERACPCCAVDRFLKTYAKSERKRNDGVAALFGTDQSAAYADVNDAPARRTNKQRLKLLQETIERLNSDADELMVADGSGGGFLSLLGKTVLGGALAGEFGMAMGMASHNHNKHSVRILDEDRFEKLLEAWMEGTDLENRLKSLMKRSRND